MRVKSRKALDDCATADVATPIGLDTPPSLYSPLQRNTITPFHDSHPTRGFQPIAIHLLYPNLAVFRILISLSLSTSLYLTHWLSLNTSLFLIHISLFWLSAPIFIIMSIQFHSHFISVSLISPLSMPLFYQIHYIPLSASVYCLWSAFRTFQTSIFLRLFWTNFSFHTVISISSILFSLFPPMRSNLIFLSRVRPSLSLSRGTSINLSLVSRPLSLKRMHLRWVLKWYDATHTIPSHTLLTHKHKHTRTHTHKNAHTTGKHNAHAWFGFKS